jgi:uncharacterized protein with HEPN domain
MFKEQELTDYLSDIIIAITDIKEFTHGMSYELFSSHIFEDRPLGF